MNYQKEDGVDRKEYQANLYPDPNNKEMEDVRFNNEREHHWRMVIEETDGGVENKKAILHSKMWYV